MAALLLLASFLWRRSHDVWVDFALIVIQSVVFVVHLHVINTVTRGGR